MRTVSLLGSTGSIGTQALDVIRREPERFRVHALAAQSSVEELLAQVAGFAPDLVVIGDPARYGEVRDRVPPGTDVMVGEEGMVAAAQSADVVLNAVVGFAGLPVTMAALESGKRLALANKESLIAGAPVVQKARRTPGAEIIPVDSEHCAVHQCLAAVHASTDVARLLLTASGGPFRGWTAERLGSVTVADALAHPTWSMGPKITIDSASLMNKGLEVIEAYHLFALKPDEIDVLVHPQSVVHGMVEFRDGSVVAQLGSPDMRIPIAHCLGWPRRIDGPAARLDLAQVRELTFEAPDLVRFPALALARRVLETGGAAPTVFNAANEVAVGEFLAGRIAFPAITALVDATLDAAAGRGLLAEAADIDAALGVDHNARSLALALLPEIAVKSS